MSWVVPNSTAPTASMTRKDAPKLRRPIRRMSMIGSERDSSHGTKARKDRTDTTAQIVMKGDLNQSSSCPLSSTISRKPRNRAERTKPIQSMRKPRRQSSSRSLTSVAGSSTKAATSASEAAPIGMLMKKIQCHEALSVR